VLRRSLNDILRIDLNADALDRLSWRDLGNGLAMSRLAREGKRELVLYRIAAGAASDVFVKHEHISGEFYLVLKGKITDETGEYLEGDMVFLDPQSVHQPRAVGDTLVLVLWPEGVRIIDWATTNGSPVKNRPLKDRVIVFPLERVSRFLSYLLRHRPKEYPLQFDPYGFAPWDAVVDTVVERFQEVTEEQIRALVIGSDKKRFELKEGKVRATYGHSFPVDLGLQPVEPPLELYYGTARDLAQSILRSGLKPRDRQYVHLSPLLDEAIAVGKRRDPVPAIVVVDARAAHGAGIRFFASGPLFLVENVPPKFLSLSRASGWGFVQIVRKAGYHRTVTARRRIEMISSDFQSHALERFGFLA
jgi:putative RNA 2'-phosphotransferase